MLSAKMSELKAGDRVTMLSGVIPQVDGKPLRLYGTVTPWPNTGGLIVIWDDWPCVTPLPNPNVQRAEDLN